MKKSVLFVSLALLAGLVGFLVLPRYLASAPPVQAQASLGKPAPHFQVVDVTGESVALSDLAGKYVVLEWWNHGCPFVQALYGDGKMQAQQNLWTGRDVQWLVVCSSAPGKQGHVTPEEAIRLQAEAGGVPTRILLDPQGVLGGLYGARTTPHMFVIDPQGVLIYAGAIDDRASKNYVEQALNEAFEGRPVSEPLTVPYGCSVKYGADPDETRRSK